MLQFKDYLSKRPGLDNKNFVHWLERVSTNKPDKDAILYRSGKQREFTRWSFSKFGEECRRVARGLLAAGLKKGDRVVLWAENRPEWMSVWIGTVIGGIYIVPVDFLATEQECLNIIKFTKAKAFFYSGRKKEFADSLASNGVSMAATVCISPDVENPPGGHKTEYDYFGLDAGAQILPAIDSIAPDHPCSIVFTSGTTGFAKGVMLSHKNILANVNGAMLSLDPDENDVFMDVLPLHHTYPTTCSFIAPLTIGLTVVIAEKIVGKVVIDDIKDGKVTFLIAVPLLYDKVMAAIGAGYKKLSPVVRFPLNILRSIALSQAKKGNPKFGQVVFKFIRKKTNLHSLKMMVAGGGPLNPKTADFFDSFGYNIVHGYGMSENSPLISVNTPRHKRNVSVGLPVKDTELKIMDPGPDGNGEIACRSPSVMLGYYENEEATKEIITEDGWLLTGDLGYIDEDGYLYIKGRKKNLIVGSGGKNVYPEEVEAHFFGSRIVDEVLVVGRKDPDGEIIFAVLVPNFENIKADYPDKENDDDFIYDLMKKLIKEANRTLPVYKKIGDFCVRKEPFQKNAQQKIKRFLYKSYENP